MTVLVFLDPALNHGRIADADQPALLVTDQAATRGDGVFETMLAVDGTVRKLQAHLDRLERSAAALTLTIPAQDAWRRAIATALTEYARTSDGDGPADDTHEGPAHDGGEAVVKLVASRGPEGTDQPTAWITVTDPPASSRAQREHGVDVLLLDRGYDSTLAERAPWLLLGAKTLSYAVNMAALRHARTHGADDVIFTSSDGTILEGPTSTVVVARIRDGERTLVTPRPETGILPGTSQGALFAAARRAGWSLGYGPLQPEDLYTADAVWLVSSIRLLTPVNSIDGRRIGTSRQVTRELAALLDGADRLATQT